MDRKRWRGSRAAGKRSRKEKRAYDAQDAKEVQLRRVGVDPPETRRKVFRIGMDPPEMGGVKGTADGDMRLVKKGVVTVGDRDKTESRKERPGTGEIDATSDEMSMMAIDDWNEGRWPAPPGSIMDMARPSSPTTVMGLQECEEMTPECSIKMIGIELFGEVIVKMLVAGGVLSDSGANVCMADTEEHLVRCHDIAPVAVGLALKSGDTPVMHECTRMGYMEMTREDGTTHLQPFLVNTNATDCIISPDAVARQSDDCVTWRQVGHIGETPGTLEFFDSKGRRIMHLQLEKKNCLYYADVNDVRAPRVEECNVYNLFTDD